MYDFLIENDSEEVVYYAVRKGEIKEMYYSDTHDENGIKIGHANVQDRITLLSTDATALVAEFGIGDVINAIDNYNEFMSVIANCDPGFDFIPWFKRCHGFNYGNQSIITSFVNYKGYCNYLLVTDHVKIKELAGTLEEMNYLKSMTNGIEFEVSGFKVISTLDSWADFKIIPVV